MDVKIRAWNRIVERMSPATSIKELKALGKAVQWQNIIIMLSTNMFDCNDIEIFEGDILRFNSTEVDYKPIKVVRYNKENACFYFGEIPFVKLFESGFCQPSSSKSFEKIGNIYQDNDLIQERL